MMTFARAFGLLYAVLAVSGCGPKEPYAIDGAASELVAEVYGSAVSTQTSTLVIFIHGAVSRGGPAHYMYHYALSASTIRSGVVGAAILRPGYYDNRGQKSPGNNYGRRDSMTPHNNRMIAKTIANLKEKYRAEKVIAVGHSAGAGTIGAIIGRTSELIDVAVLVSCPCNIPQWRSMNGRRSYVRSESPHEVIDTIPASVKVYALTGEMDDNTHPAIAKRYITRLEARGIKASFHVVPAAGHNYGGTLAAKTMEIVRAEVIDAGRIAAVR